MSHESYWIMVISTYSEAVNRQFFGTDFFCLVKARSTANYLQTVLRLLKEKVLSYNII